MLADAGNQPEPGGGAVAFNIAYGDTAPADTSKLWVKTSAPTTVEIADRVAHSGETIDIGVADFPDPIAHAASVVIDNNIYTFSGRNSDGSSEGYFFKFDTETHKTTQLSFHGSRMNAACASIGREVYLIGFEDTSGNMYGTIYRYDIDTRELKRLTELPQYGCYFAAAAVGNKIYIFGGLTASSSESTASRAPSRKIYEYNTVTNVITELTHGLDIPLYNIGAVAVGTKIYLFGGRASNGTKNTIRVYDTATENLSSALTTLDVSMPVTEEVTPVLLGENIYFCDETTVYKFDIKTETFSTLDGVDLPYNCLNSIVAAVGDKLYIIGGVDGTYRTGIHILSTNSQLTAGKLLIETCIHGKKADLVNANGTALNLGIKNVYIGNSDGYAEKVPAYLYQDGAWVEV
jgi:hypothetical protein